MKQCVSMLAALLVLFTLCACEPMEPTPTAEPSASAGEAASTDIPAASDTPVEPNAFACTEAFVMPYSQFITEEQLAAYSSLDDDTDGWKRYRYPAWTVSGGMLCYIGTVDNKLHVVDAQTGVETLTLDASPHEIAGYVTYGGDIMYALTRSQEGQAIVNAFDTTGTILWTLQVPPELYEIEPDPNATDNPYLGGVSICMVDSKPFLRVYVNNITSIYYEISYESSAFIKTTPPCTVAHGVDGGCVITFPTGLSVTLSEIPEAEVLIAVDRDGFIYTYEIDTHMYLLRYSEGSICASCNALDYACRVETMYPVIYGGDGCLYLVDFGSHGYLLVRIPLK